MKASVGCQQLFLIDLIYLLLWYSSKSYLLAEARIKLLLHKTKMLNIVILKVSCKCIWRLLDIFFIVHYMRKNLEGIFSEWLLRSCWTGQRCIFWWWFPNLKMVIDKSRTLEGHLPPEWHSPVPVTWISQIRKQLNIVKANPKALCFHWQFLELTRGKMGVTVLLGGLKNGEG